MSEKQNKPIRRVVMHPRAAVVLHDLAMVFLAWTAGRFIADRLFALPILETYALGGELPLVLVLQGLVLWATGLYKGIWRFASFKDMWNIARAALFGAALIFAGLLILRGGQVAGWYPEVLVYPLMLFVALALPRMTYRSFKDSRLPPGQGDADRRRVVILGAGRSGALLERELRHRGGYELLGYLDDNPRLRGGEVNGIPVLGVIEDLPTLAGQLSLDRAIIAIPSATNQQMQRIVRVCEDSGVEFRTLPTLQDLGNQATRIDKLKRVAIDDLLGRAPVSLDWDALRTGLVGKRVMVTGGGGSIGSELCRQIARLNPAELVVVDHSEYALYRIDLELRSAFDDLLFTSILGDICDPATVETVVARFQPEVIFHAAAYKHLPILQNQVREAVRNNVTGTMRLAEAADRHGVGTFVLISTDKAVNPANVMGATKRVAEMYCQGMNERSATRFVTVRFGNVLNSNGSVVPLFKEQIRRGGPVTVTHPEITRYFMTIAEASQLIMQAALQGQGGEVYVLDMGEPVRITFLAEQLIRLAGKEPGRDIQIVYTGLRPGEKLFEELFHELEPNEQTGHEKIFLAHPRSVDWVELREELSRVEASVQRYDVNSIEQGLYRLVPELRQPAMGRDSATVVPLHRAARKS
jgi:FlaA1/EpsC-like NDP-sugar epimerase